MIRINLVRNRVGDAVLPNAPLGGAATLSESSDGTRDAIVKVASICVFTVGLMLYESQTIQQLNEERSRTDALVADLESQTQAKAIEVEAIKDIAQQAQELESKLKVIKLLSKLRLREVKTLDFMQSSIPEKVWLKSIKYESAKDAEMGNPDAKSFNFEEGSLVFEGNSVTTEDLSEFVKRLDDSAYLTEVIVVKNQESTAVSKSAALREFQFTADVEVGK